MAGALVGSLPLVILHAFFVEDYVKGRGKTLLRRRCEGFELN
jgi:hypothetical protein